MYKGKYERQDNPAAPKPQKSPSPQPSPPIEQPPRPLPRQRTRQSEPAQRTRQSEPMQRATPQRRKRPKKPTKGTYIFYGVYLAVILAFFIGIAVIMGALKDWLISYEAAQPETKSQQVFQQLFADPDWAHIYTLANPDDSESKDEYAAYMQKLVGDDQLTFIETAAGLSGDRKYIVCRGQDAVAIFTLTPDDKNVETPDWQLGSVEVFFSRYLSYNIITLPGCTVTVDGKALDESHIIRTVATKAEGYLPEGIHGYRLQELQITGLKSEPTIVVTDAQGQTVDMNYDEATKTYTQVMPELPIIGDTEYSLVLATAKAYSDFMIAGTNNLPKYFDTKSTIYKTITGGMIIRQNYSSYKFEKETISDYYRYSDDLFSAKINLVTKVTRTNGSIKEFEVDSTLIFQKINGKWVVRDMVNVDIQEQMSSVRLTFKDESGNILSSELVDAHSNRLSTPSITAPEGKQLAGWFMEIVDEQGNTTLALAFKPDASGNVTLGQALEPMTLVPRFEEAA